MTAIKHETEIAADPTVPLVRITREFDATPAQVFRAHTDPDLLAQWLGPRGLEMEVLTFDCRTGIDQWIVVTARTLSGPSS